MNEVVQNAFRDWLHWRSIPPDVQAEVILEMQRQRCRHSNWNTRGYEPCPDCGITMQDVLMARTPR